MLQRTVDLGDECGRPSTTILGMLSWWLDIQGNDAAAKRTAQRGIDLAPSPDDADAALCWFEFSGASAGTEAWSPAAVAAFRHQSAAVANTPSIEMNWPELVNLIDASLNADRSATAALRQRLKDVAASVRSPRLTLIMHQFEGHACLTASPPDFTGAVAAYERVAEVARSSGDLQFDVLALRALAMAYVGLGAPDALTRCHDALAALFEVRYWQKIWQTLESVTLALAVAGRTEHAALVLGRLDAHSPGFGIERGLGFRQRARDLIEADGAHAAAQSRGAGMSPEELVTTAIAFCAVG
jgi:hypothetical protein